VIIWEVLDHCDHEELCNYDNGRDTNIYKSEESINSGINLENEESEEELMCAARVQRPTLEYQGDWQWGKVDSSYRPSKIRFSEISSPIQPVRSASKAFKLYFDDSIKGTVVIETNWHAVNFVQTHKNKLKP
jgi:hypothetical protein